MRGVTDLDTVHGGPQPLLQLGQFAAQVRVIPHQLFVHLRQLIQVVLQKTDLLFLRERASVVFVVLCVHRLHKETVNTTATRQKRRKTFSICTSGGSVPVGTKKL